MFSKILGIFSWVVYSLTKALFVFACMRENRIYFRWAIVVVRQRLLSSNPVELAITVFSTTICWSSRSLGLDIHQIAEDVYHSYCAGTKCVNNSYVKRFLWYQLVIYLKNLRYFKSYQDSRSRRRQRWITTILPTSKACFSTSAFPLAFRGHKIKDPNLYFKPILFFYHDEKLLSSCILKLKNFSIII